MTEKVSQIIDIRSEKNICLTGMTDEFFCWYIKSYFEKKHNKATVKQLYLRERIVG